MRASLIRRFSQSANPALCRTNRRVTVDALRAWLLLLAVSQLCNATSIPPISFEELVTKSDQIVFGTVGRSWTSWGSEHKVIWTRYEIRVSGAIKGPTEATVIVSEPGGSLGGFGMRVEGAVPYGEGEQVLLFLETYPGGIKRTVGWAQGKFMTSPDGRVYPCSLGGRTKMNIRTRVREATPISSLRGITTVDLLRRIAAIRETQKVK
jgi:hypothetical protein